MSDTNNPPAFPIHPNCLPACTDMTLWDWFAGQALAGECYDVSGEQAVCNAARTADAMMAERAKRSAVKSQRIDMLVLAACGAE